MNNFQDSIDDSNKKILLLQEGLKMIVKTDQELRNRNQGKESEIIVINYTNTLITAMNPRINQWRSQGVASGAIAPV